MKANLKGLGDIKGLLLAHGEKIGIALVGLCAIMFVYSTLSHEPLPDQFQAPQLKSQIAQVMSEVKETTWPDDPKDENVRIANLAVRADNIKVDPRFYVGSHKGWDPPVIPPTVLRSDPELLAAVEVEVSAGSGLLAFEDERFEKQRALQEELKKQEEDKRREAERARDEAQGEDARGGRKGRGDDDREDSLIDPDRPNLRRVASGVDPPGVMLDGSERIDTAYWAVVVAKVPIKEQLKLYRDVLANARGYDPEYDAPQYVGYVVQRAEVIPGQPLDFKQISVYDGQKVNIPGRPVATVVSAGNLQKVTEFWADSQEEVVDSRFLDPNDVLAFPLPPLVWRNWREEATHSDIPLIENDEGLELLESEAAVEESAGPGAADDPENMFSAAELREGGRAGRSVPSRGGGARRGGGFSSRGRDGTNREMAGGREMGGRAGGGRSMRGRGEGAFVLAKDVTHWLLRFYDFGVEPGKRYQYQVRLVLADANSLSPGDRGRVLTKDDVDQTVLNRHSEEKGPKGIRYTDWSESSKPVGIPLAGDVRVAGARGANPNLFNDEPRVNLLIQSFGIDKNGQAFQATKQKNDLRRGSVANMTDDVEILVDYGDHIDLLKSFAFRTGITVLDVRGGERLSTSRNLTVPSETLLMNPTGQLYVRRELKDFSDVELHKLLFAEPDERRGGGDGRRGGDTFMREGGRR